MHPTKNQFLLTFVMNLKTTPITLKTANVKNGGKNRTCDHPSRLPFTTNMGRDRRLRQTANVGVKLGFCHISSYLSC